MNVLVLSHTSVLASYRRKWEILSTFPDVRLTLVIEALHRRFGEREDVRR